MDLEWMAWTLPTAIFFAVIVLMLVGMTVWQIRSPSVPRRGFLPMETTRGDRLFLALMGAALIHLGWVAFSQELLWVPLALSAVFLIVMLRYG